MPIDLFWGVAESQYDDPDLCNLPQAESGARLIADSMTKYLRFDPNNVRLMTRQDGVDQAIMEPTKDKIKAFAERIIDEVRRGDLIIDKCVAYFAVHGFLNGERNKRYLCLRTTRTDDLANTALSYGQVLEWLLAFNARDTVFMGDVCQELAYTAGAARNELVMMTETEADETRKLLRARSVHAPRNNAVVRTRANVVQIDACGPFEHTYDGLYAPLFAESVEKLARQYSRVSIGQIARRTAEEVARTPYGNICHPCYTIEQGCGDVSFMTNAVEPERNTPEREPETLSDLLALAKTALDDKRFADAQARIRRALELAPENKRALVYAGKAEKGVKEVNELKENFLALVDDAWDAVGGANDDEQKWLKAFQLTQEAAELVKRNKHAFDAKDEGEVQALVDEAEEPAKKVELKNRLANIEKLLSEGVALFKANKWDDASAKADAILEVDPENTKALKMKGACQKKIDEQERAQKIDAALVEAERLLRAGQYAAASGKAEEVLQLNPSNARALELRKRIDAARKAAEEEEKSRWLIGTPGEKRVLTIKDLPWTFIYCPPTGPNGFMMGSPENEEGREPWSYSKGSEKLHKVILTKPAWLMDTVVTQSQYHSLMSPNGKSSFCASGDNSSKVSGLNTDNFPIERVSWNEFQELVKKLNEMKDKLGVPAEWYFSLPTEALWEYACRNFGESQGPYNAGKLDDCGWYSGNSGGRTHEVRKKKANKYGFYDFHGNVWEWCYDSWKNPLTDATDPCYDEQGASRVYRGGGWDSGARRCRAAYRINNSSDSQCSNLGARLALVLKQ